LFIKALLAEKEFAGLQLNPQAITFRIESQHLEIGAGFEGQN
jgi:hypothetical protein